MKCKTHRYESGVGVCASCLRERLLPLVAAQDELPSSSYHHQPRRRSDPPPPPPPLVFPRSVSPYVSRRRSAGSDASPSSAAHNQRFLRFFSTPQVGPAAGSGWIGGIDSGRRRRRFSILRSLFGRRHARTEEAKPGFPDPEASPAGSWLSALIGGKRRNGKKLQLSEEETAAQQGRTVRPWKAADRGISPEHEDEDKGDDGSEFSGDEWRRPTPTPMRRFRQHRSLGAAQGLSVSLSPLVRLRPDSSGRRQAPDAGISGDLRSLENIHRRNPAVAPTRSKKKMTDPDNFK